MEQDKEIEILSTKNALFCVYLLCSALLILKMMGVVLLTIFHRFKNRAFISEEDTTINGGNVAINEDVERVRRAHQNDIENILPFLLIGLLYLFTKPAQWLAVTLYLLFLIVRVFHTFVYAIYVVRQPARAISFIIGFLIMGYMSIRCGLHGIITIVDQHI